MPQPSAIFSILRAAAISVVVWIPEGIPPGQKRVGKLCDIVGNVIESGGYGGDSGNEGRNAEPREQKDDQRKRV